MPARGIRKRIVFKHPKVVKYILSEESLGYVATMRMKPRKKGEWLVADVNGLKFLANVIDCVSVTDDNIKKYVEFSGFATPREWLEEARRIHGGRSPKYIVFLKLVHDKSLQK